MKRTHKRQDLIHVGRDIIVRQGFNATGLSDILATAGVPKGSFYYYFESKEDFGLAIIEDFANEYQRKLDATISNQQLSPLSRLRQYFELGIQEMEANQYETGCLIGNLAQELAAQNEHFRERLDQILNDWETQFASCVADAQKDAVMDNDSSAVELAKFILAGWQGATLRAKTSRSPTPLRNFVHILFTHVLNRPDLAQPITAESVAG
ncbi:MAG: TetR family transcriptional regulator C-terminal domain-containing protein [Cyanobacteria bacterium J06581_3]